MGNRAVIVSHDTNANNANEKIGVYVHWHGDQEDVQAVLDICKDAGVRTVSGDTTYFWARFCQAFANYISGGKVEETSIGIGIVKQLDCDNGDNGVYYVDDNFSIVNHTNGRELYED